MTGTPRAALSLLWAARGGVRGRDAFAPRRAGRAMMQVFRNPAMIAARALALGFALLALALPADAADDLAKIPPLAARVTDLTNTLSTADRQALETKLAAWETQTGNQLVVLIVPSTQPEAIASYSIRVAEAWKIGRKGKDNGAIFLIAKDDRKNRIEVGYGLEGVLTDVTCRRILAETVAPFFRNGQFAQGINAGVDQIIDVVTKGDPLPDAPAAQAPQRRKGGISLDTIFLLLFVVVPVVGGILRRLLGNAVGSTVGAGIVGGAAWFIAGSLLIAGIAAVVAFIVMITFGVGGGLTGRGGGIFIPGGGGGGGFGGGGFSGGGGGFGGGGASGDW
jgi:uncharacterized protein